jgi:hypothetical protein
MFTPMRFNSKLCVCGCVIHSEDEISDDYSEGAVEQEGNVETGDDSNHGSRIIPQVDGAADCEFGWVANVRARERAKPGYANRLVCWFGIMLVPQSIGVLVSPACLRNVRMFNMNMGPALRWIGIGA